MRASNELLSGPRLGIESGDLHALRVDLLRLAADVYLGLAYQTGVIPLAVARRLSWPDGIAAHDLLGACPFERADKGSGHASAIYALRLGNSRYPHMKLQIQPWPNEAGFMLSVNTHDQISGLELVAADARAFRELQAENQRLKEAIEQAWDEAGLPTFHRYLRDYIDSRSECLGAIGADPNREHSAPPPDLSPLP